MGIAVMILGESGSGKSTSLRNFDTGEVGIFNVASKPLPFRKKLSTFNTKDYGVIKATLQKNSLKAYVIDDSQYLMAFDSFDNAKVTGYGKFTDMAINFKSLIDTAINETDSDTVVYFLHHEQTDETGKIKAKTIGKMLDNQLTIEGLFPVVLHAVYKGGQYVFETQTNGATTTKSPLGMFEGDIENDLKKVDSTIREYWSLSALGAKNE